MSEIPKYPQAKIGSDRITDTSGRPFSEVAVAVEAVLGVIELSVDNLLDLSSGQVFEYQFDPSVPVRLKVGSETIATARFVQHENSLCLQIESVE